GPPGDWLCGRRIASQQSCDKCSRPHQGREWRTKSILPLAYASSWQLIARGTRSTLAVGGGDERPLHRIESGLLHRRRGQHPFRKGVICGRDFEKPLREFDLTQRVVFQRLAFRRRIKRRPDLTDHFGKPGGKLAGVLRIEVACARRRLLPVHGYIRQENPLAEQVSLLDARIP